MKLPLRCFAIVLGLLASFDLRAQLVSYHLRGNLIVSDFNTSFVVGDSYNLTFTLDLSATDTSPDSTEGVFQAVRNLSFSLGSGSVGTYAEGTLTLGSITLVDGDGRPDYATLAFTGDTPGVTFDSAEGYEFASLQIELWSGNDLIFGSIPDLGGRLADMLVTPFSTAEFGGNLVRLSFSDDLMVMGSIDVIESSSLSGIPEPSTWSLVAASAVFAITVARRGRKKSADA